MSYLTQARLAGDQIMTSRIAACAANEGIPEPYEWAAERMWQLSAEPGWDDAYAYAIANGAEEPGRNEDAVTDGMILAAVRALNSPAE